MIISEQCRLQMHLACQQSTCDCTCHDVHVPADVPAAPEMVNHPQHYGGADNPYEAIKVIEAHNLGFCLGNAVKYILRCEHKGTPLEDLRKAAWYLNREIEKRAMSVYP